MQAGWAIALCALLSAAHARADLASTVAAEVRARPWDIPRITVDPSGVTWKGFALKPPGAFFDLARSHGWRKEFRLPSKTVTFDFQRIRAGKKTIYDGKSAFEQLAEGLIEASDESEPAWTLGEDEGDTVVPLSLVGSLLSYEELQHSGGGGPVGGHPYSYQEWKSVDLDTGKPPEILKFAEETSLVEALAKDSCISNSVEESVLKKVASFEELRGAFSTGDKDDNCRGLHAFDTFAVLDYDRKKDLVALRIGFKYEQGGSHTKTSFVGIWVKPTVSFRGALSQAKAGKGFFIGEYRKWR